MKAVTLTLLLAAICGVALCGRTIWYDTPEGPMTMNQLEQIYRKFSYHKFDFAVEDSIKLVKTWIKQLDELLNKPETRRTLRKNFNDLKVILEEFVFDLSDEKAISKCGMETVADYYMETIEEFGKNTENETIKTLCDNLFDEFRNVAEEPKGDADLNVFRSIKKDNELWEEVSEAGKLRPYCCKYVTEDMIHGQC